MLKPAKIIISVLIAGFLCVPCIADRGGSDTKKMKAAKKDYADFDLYPAESLKNKGVLYMSREEFFKKQMAMYVVGKNGESRGIWYVGGDNVSIYDASKDAAMVPKWIKIASIDPRDIYIAAKEFFNAIDAGEFYIVSARVVSSEGYYAIPLRISKKYIDAYRFKFIPLESIVEICKKNLDMAKDMVGAEITPSEADIEKMLKNAKNEIKPEIVGEPGEEIILVGADGLPEPPKRLIYLIRKKPSLSAPFVYVKEPEINQKKILFKKNYWYELEVSVDMNYAPDLQTDKKYTGGKYRGFWQAPYDSSGFPYLLTEMVQDSWEKLAEEYFSDLETH
ncbi:MAG: hypothetical protein FWH43_00305 [Endomicrobia bacterium]|nr:hypothetical protein [Endomicrobiia bacterium]